MLPITFSIKLTTYCLFVNCATSVIVNDVLKSVRVLAIRYKVGIAVDDPSRITSMLCIMPYDKLLVGMFSLVFAFRFIRERRYNAFSYNSTLA